MRRTLTKISIIIAVAILGFCLGMIYVNPSTRIHKGSVSITCGGGDYDKETFTRVNMDAPGKINELLNSNFNHDILVVVSPDTCGYQYYIVAPKSSPIWLDSKYRNLKEWIGESMDKNELEIQEIYSAEQDAAPN